MKTYALQKRLAAQLLKVGKNKIWLDPTKLKDIGDAITKIDITELIKEKIIKKMPVAGVKRRAGKLRQIRKKKRGRKAVGRKKRTVKKKKTVYMHKVRKLRSYLSTLKKENSIDSKQYQKLRSAVKAGLVNTKHEIKSKIEK